MQSLHYTVQATACTSSYGATLVPAGGQGLVAWVKQLSEYLSNPINLTPVPPSEQPSTVQCSMDSTALTFPNSDAITSDSCSVSKNWEQITFSSCVQTAPDSTDKFHMEPEAATDATKVTIKQAGYYRVELTALLTISKFPTRADVFKVSTKDPAAACGTIASACSPLLQLRGQGASEDGTLSYIGSRSTNGGVLASLCPGDKLVVVASKSGNVANTANAGTVEGGPQGVRTIFTITKAWHGSESLLAKFDGKR